MNANTQAFQLLVNNEENFKKNNIEYKKKKKNHNRSLEKMIPSVVLPLGMKCNHYLFMSILMLVVYSHAIFQPPCVLIVM